MLHRSGVFSTSHRRRDDANATTAGITPPPLRRRETDLSTAPGPQCATLRMTLPARGCWGDASSIPVAGLTRSHIHRSSSSGSGGGTRSGGSRRPAPPLPRCAIAHSSDDTSAQSARASLATETGTDDRRRDRDARVGLSRSRLLEGHRRHRRRRGDECRPAAHAGREEPTARDRQSTAVVDRPHPRRRPAGGPLPLRRVLHRR